MASLQALSSSVLENAKNLYKKKMYIHILTFIFVAISIFVEGLSLYIFATLALLSELSVWFINLFANSKKSLEQELIRLNILKNSYGDLLTIDTAYLKQQVSAKEYEDSITFEKESYYATTEIEGNKKLLDILQESCFWSHHLYSACKTNSIKNAVIMSLVILILIVSTLSIANIDQNYSLPRVALLFLVFFPLWNEISKSISYGVASSRLALIDHKIENTTLETPLLMSLFADYNVVTSSTELIPQKVYDNEEKKLNDLWAERVK